MLQEKIAKLTHSTNVNSIAKNTDFSYSDKHITVNKYGSPIIKIEEFKVCGPPRRNFQEIHLKKRLKTQKNELKHKILLGSGGLSPIFKRKIHDESLMSPLFKQPREPDRMGLAEICDIETPYCYQKARVFSDKLNESKKKVLQSYENRGSTVGTFKKIEKTISQAFNKQNLRSSAIFQRTFAESLAKTQKPRDSRRKREKLSGNSNKNKISLNELEKKFMSLQKQTIEAYFQGKNVDQSLINKDFMAYTLENAHSLAKTKSEMRKQREILNKPPLLRVSSASVLRNPEKPCENSEKTGFSKRSREISSAKRPIIKHLSVKEKKLRERQENNEKTIRKIQERLLWDLEGLGELERNALANLSEKFLLYNHTNYEILDSEKRPFLNRKQDLRTKHFLNFTASSFEKNKSPMKTSILFKEKSRNYANYRKNSLNSKWKREGGMQNSVIFKENERKSEENAGKTQEKYLNELKEFKRKFEVTSLNEEEMQFLASVKRNDYNSVKFALISNPNFVYIKDKLNQTPLHWAAKRGFSKLTLLICKYKPDFSVKDLLGRTALEIAVEKGNKKIINIIEYNSSYSLEKPHLEQPNIFV